MTLPSSGSISLSQIEYELYGTSTNQVTLNDGAVRQLLGDVPSASNNYAGTTLNGQISASNAYGKSVFFTYYFTSSVNDVSLNVSNGTGSGLWVTNGIRYNPNGTHIYVVVYPGVYLWASSVSSYGLNLYGAGGNDVCYLINNGYIIGQGGYGGQAGDTVHAQSGGPALALPCTTYITNNGYIAGGGGGGGMSDHNPQWSGPGGGGAGGGHGNYFYDGAGGGIGSTGGGPYGGGAGGAGGQNGYYAASGGGRILPGSGGSNGGFFGQGAGGSSNGAGYYGYATGYMSNGGIGGGGGGWGASGGQGGSGNFAAGYPGGAGGAAIVTNGHGVSVGGAVWGGIV